MYATMTRFKIQIDPAPGSAIAIDPEGANYLHDKWGIKLVDMASGMMLVGCAFDGSEREAWAAAPALLQEKLRNLRCLASTAIGELDRHLRRTGGTVTPPSGLSEQVLPIMNGSYVENGMLSDADRAAESIVENYGLGVLVEVLKTIIAEHSDSHTLECALHMLSCVNGEDPIILEVARLCEGSNEPCVQEQLIGLFDGNYVEGCVEVLRAMPDSTAWVNNYRNEVLEDLEQERTRRSNHGTQA